MDIETNGLDPSVIWVACCRHNGVTEVICNEEDFKAYVSSKGDASYVFHNGIGFDVRVVANLWHTTLGRSRVIDTLVLSRLADPSKSGGHSLRNWGNILGFPKGDHSDWSQLSEEMITYCMQDVEVTQAVHEKLLKELEGFSQESQDLEHQVAWCTVEQERNGWLVDQRKCYDL